MASRATHSSSRTTHSRTRATSRARSHRIPRRSTRPRHNDNQAQHNREGSSMEARVDVRKLQILNDRINQTIDALNQVRLSVHGLGHSGLQNPFMTQGYGMPRG